MKGASQQKVGTISPAMPSQIEGILKESERFYVKDIIDDRLVILSSIMVSQKDDGIIATEIEKCINEYEGALFFLESSKNLTSMRKRRFLWQF